MRYLLVGNGAATDIATKAKHADAVIQINRCAHREAIAPEKMSHVCVVNTVDPAAFHDTVAMLRGLNLPAHTKIVFTRNPAFYWLKSFAAWLYNPDGLRCFLPFKIDLAWSSETVSFLATCLLEFRMLRAGMPLRNLPSTGMVAFDWLSKKLRPGDSLDIDGFTFEGWDRHSWDVERQLIKGIYPPGYRDDPS
jgi:hypothetical protein